MRKLISVFLVLLSIVFILTACNSKENKEEEAKYIQTAETIFSDYFKKNYPEKSYEVKNLEVLKDKKVDLLSTNKSKMVKGTLVDNQEEISVYCYIDGKDHNVYTSKYFDNVKNEVDAFVKNKLGLEIDASLIQFEGTWKSQWAMGFMGAEFKEFNLLPYSIRTAKDLFTYDEASWFYHLNVEATLKKDILLEDLQFEVFFNDISNAKSNDVDIRIHTSENSKLHYMYANALVQGDNSIKVTPEPRTVKIENEDCIIEYSDYMFAIDIEQTPFDYRNMELTTYEQNYLSKQEEEGFIKTDYIYTVNMKLNYPFEGKEKMEIRKTHGETRLIYDFSAYGDVMISEPEPYIQLTRRYTESFADRSSKYLHNFIQDFRPESTKDKDEITFYLDVYIND